MDCWSTVTRSLYHCQLCCFSGLDPQQQLLQRFLPSFDQPLLTFKSFSLYTFLSYEESFSVFGVLNKFITTISLNHCPTKLQPVCHFNVFCRVPISWIPSAFSLFSAFFSAADNGSILSASSCAFWICSPTSA